MSHRKVILRFIGHPTFKISQQIKPGLKDDYGTVLPEATGSWLVDEIISRTTALGTTSSIHLIDYASISYKD